MSDERGRLIAGRYRLGRLLGQGGFIVTSGQEYYVQLTALSATWQQSQSIFGVFFATFRPS